MITTNADTEISVLLFVVYCLRVTVGKAGNVAAMVSPLVSACPGAASLAHKQCICHDNKQATTPAATLAWLVFGEQYLCAES